MVIWTTTPWTLPGNRAIAFDKDETYALVEVTARRRVAPARSASGCCWPSRWWRRPMVTGRADRRLEARSLAGADLLGSRCRHPLRGQGYDFDGAALAGDFVTMDQGTGFVHIAPGHGADDFELGRDNGLEVPQTVDGDGVFLPHVPLFAGDRLYPRGQGGRRQRPSWPPWTKPARCWPAAS